SLRPVSNTLSAASEGRSKHYANYTQVENSILIVFFATGQLLQCFQYYSHLPSAELYPGHLSQDPSAGEFLGTITTATTIY
ncbi:hypothetical protein, partial [Ruegeria sp. ANG-S4]|uniref:hypothetical protein n=1 Tax=Ruegeria sp. ANG-S4 TaxID=1577904 RepID=UPI0019D3ED21